MENRTADSGVQFVLDNRKLLILFAVLIGICGGFFVLGYVEGKRQGTQLAAQNASPIDTASMVAESTQNAQPSNAGVNESAKKDLNWYQNIGGVEKKDSETPEPAIEPLAKTTPPQVKTPEKTAVAESKAKKPAASATKVATSVSYSVQVGAFRQRKEAERKAGMLKEKGYESTISTPSEPDQFYLLKVGKYDSRADAVAMLLRLKEDGFAGFVKTN